MMRRWQHFPARTTTSITATTPPWLFHDRWHGGGTLYIRKIEDKYIISPPMHRDMPIETLAGPFDTLDAAKAAAEIMENT